MCVLHTPPGPTCRAGSLPFLSPASRSAGAHLASRRRRSARAWPAEAGFPFESKAQFAFQLKKKMDRCHVAQVTSSGGGLAEVKQGSVNTR